MIHAGGPDDTWYTATQISDWTTVRSFRVTAFQEDNGAKPAWRPADTIVLSAPMIAPTGAPTSTSDPLDLSIAWNSVAHRHRRQQRQRGPASGFASVSNLVSVTAGGAPTSEVDTNDTDGAEGETNNSTMDLSDTNIDLTIDSGFVLDVIDSGGRPPPVLQGA